MPAIDHRERCFRALWQRLDSLTWFVERMQEDLSILDTENRAAPRLALFAGGTDLLDPHGPNEYRVGHQAEIVVHVRAEETPEQMRALLNEARARVRRAIGEDPTLGGLIREARWIGDDEPLRPLTGGLPEATMSINYLLDTFEGVDPYLPE